VIDGQAEIPLAGYEALAEFRYQIRRFLHFSEQMASEAGITPQQHQLLLIVKGMPVSKKATIGEVAERLQIQHHSAVELVDRLVERGFVERQRDTEDMRCVIVRLTDRGEEMLQRLSVVMLAEMRQTGPALVRSLSRLIEQERKAGYVTDPRQGPVYRGGEASPEAQRRTR
jgi:DNA-binding MarR family transcriptional regulator